MQSSLDDVDFSRHPTVEVEIYDDPEDTTKVIRIENEVFIRDCSCFEDRIKNLRDEIGIIFHEERADLFCQNCLDALKSKVRQIKNLETTTEDTGKETVCSSPRLWKSLPKFEVDIPISAEENEEVNHQSEEDDNPLQVKILCKKGCNRISLHILYPSEKENVPDKCFIRQNIARGSPKGEGQTENVKTFKNAATLTDGVVLNKFPKEPRNPELKNTRVQTIPTRKTFSTHRSQEQIHSDSEYSIIKQASQGTQTYVREKILEYETMLQTKVISEGRVTKTSRSPTRPVSEPIRSRCLEIEDRLKWLQAAVKGLDESKLRRKISRESLPSTKNEDRVKNDEMLGNDEFPIAVQARRTRIDVLESFNSMILSDSDSYLSDISIEIQQTPSLIDAERVPCPVKEGFEKFDFDNSPDHFHSYEERKSLKTESSQKIAKYFPSRRGKFSCRRVLYKKIKDHRPFQQVQKRNLRQRSIPYIEYHFEEGQLPASVNASREKRVSGGKGFFKKMLQLKKKRTRKNSRKNRSLSGLLVRKKKPGPLPESKNLPQEEPIQPLRKGFLRNKKVPYRTILAGRSSLLSNISITKQESKIPTGATDEVVDSGVCAFDYEDDAFLVAEDEPSEDIAKKLTKNNKGYLVLGSVLRRKSHMTLSNKKRVHSQLTVPILRHEPFSAEPATHSEKAIPRIQKSITRTSTVSQTPSIKQTRTSLARIENSKKLMSEISNTVKEKRSTIKRRITKQRYNFRKFKKCKELEEIPEEHSSHEPPLEIVSKAFVSIAVNTLPMVNVEYTQTDPDSEYKELGRSSCETSPDSSKRESVQLDTGSPTSIPVTRMKSVSCSTMDYGSIGKDRKMSHGSRSCHCMDIKLEPKKPVRPPNYGGRFRDMPYRCYAPCQYMKRTIRPSEEPPNTSQENKNRTCYNMCPTFSMSNSNIYGRKKLFYSSHETNKNFGDFSIFNDALFKLVEASNQLADIRRILNEQILMKRIIFNKASLKVSSLEPINRTSFTVYPEETVYLKDRKFSKPGLVRRESIHKERKPSKASRRETSELLPTSQYQYKPSSSVSSLGSSPKRFSKTVDFERDKSMEDIIEEKKEDGEDAASDEHFQIARFQIHLSKIVIKPADTFFLLEIYGNAAIFMAWSFLHVNDHYFSPVTKLLSGKMDCRTSFMGPPSVEFMHYIGQHEIEITLFLMNNGLCITLGRVYVNTSPALLQLNQRVHVLSRLVSNDLDGMLQCWIRMDCQEKAVINYVKEVLDVLETMDEEHRPKKTYQFLEDPKEQANEIIEDIIVRYKCRDEHTSYKSYQNWKLTKQTRKRISPISKSVEIAEGYLNEGESIRAKARLSDTFKCNVFDTLRKFEEKVFGELSEEVEFLNLPPIQELESDDSVIETNLMTSDINRDISFERLTPLMSRSYSKCEWDFKEGLYNPETFKIIKFPGKAVKARQRRVVERTGYFSRCQHSFNNPKFNFNTYQPKRKRCKNEDFHSDNFREDIADEIFIEILAIYLEAKTVLSVSKEHTYLYVDYCFLGHCGTELESESLRKQDRMLLHFKRYFCISKNYCKRERSILRELMRPNHNRVVRFLIVSEPTVENRDTMDCEEVAYADMSLRELIYDNQADHVEEHIPLISTISMDRVGSLALSVGGLNLLRLVGEETDFNPNEDSNIETYEPIRRRYRRDRSYSWNKRRQWRRRQDWRRRRHYY